MPIGVSLRRRCIPVSGVSTFRANGRLDNVESKRRRRIAVVTIARGLRRRFLHTSDANFTFGPTVSLARSGARFDRTKPRMCVVYGLFAQAKIQRDRAIRLEQAIG